jgi:hypothetical protein
MSEEWTVVGKKQKKPQQEQQRVQRQPQAPPTLDAKGFDSLHERDNDDDDDDDGEGDGVLSPKNNTRHFGGVKVKGVANSSHTIKHHDSHKAAPSHVVEVAVPASDDEKAAQRSTAELKEELKEDHAAQRRRAHHSQHEQEIVQRSTDADEATHMMTLNLNKHNNWSAAASSASIAPSVPRVDPRLKQRKNHQEVFHYEGFGDGGRRNGEFRRRFGDFFVVVVIVVVCRNLAAVLSLSATHRKDARQKVNDFLNQK